MFLTLRRGIFIMVSTLCSVPTQRGKFNPPCFVTIVFRHHRVSSPSCIVATVFRHHRVSSPPCFVATVFRRHRVSSPPCFVATVFRRHRVSSPPCFVVTMGLHVIPLVVIPSYPIDCYHVRLYPT